MYKFYEHVMDYNEHSSYFQNGSSDDNRDKIRYMWQLFKHQVPFGGTKTTPEQQKFLDQLLPDAYVRVKDGNKVEANIPHLPLAPGKSS